MGFGLQKLCLWEISVLLLRDFIFLVQDFVFSELHCLSSSISMCDMFQVASRKVFNELLVLFIPGTFFLVSVVYAIL